MSKKHETIIFNNIIDAFFITERFRVKESTFSHYKNITDSRIRSEFGHLRPDDIDSTAVELFSHKLMTDGRRDGNGGLSAKTVRDILSILKMILAYGIKKGYFDEDILEFSLPKVNKQKPDILKKEEVKILKQKALESRDTYKFGVFLCLYTGLRIGEICALRWEDIDLINGVLSVNRTMLRIYSADEKSRKKTKIITDSPKTESGRRDIPLPSSVCAELRNRNINDPSCYILTNSSKYIEPRLYYSKYKKFLKECGVSDHSFHALRHTFATRCASLGFDPKSLSEILGHSDVKITLERYVHPSMDIKRTYMNKLD